MEPDPIKVGAHIHRLRKRRQLTQVQLGELLHISFQAVSKWERGETLPDVGGGWYMPYYQWCVDKRIINPGRFPAAGLNRSLCHSVSIHS